jgi:hypothetical protein
MDAYSNLIHSYHIYNGGGKIKENDEGIVNLTITYSKNFCKCYNVPPVKQ